MLQFDISFSDEDVSEEDLKQVAQKARETGHRVVQKAREYGRRAYEKGRQTYRTARDKSRNVYQKHFGKPQPAPAVEPEESKIKVAPKKSHFIRNTAIAAGVGAAGTVAARYGHVAHQAGKYYDKRVNESPSKGMEFKSADKKTNSSYCRKFQKEVVKEQARRDFKIKK